MNADWVTDVTMAIETQSMDQFIEVLRRLSTSHANTPTTAMKTKIIKQVDVGLKPNSSELFTFACALAKSDSDAAHEIGAVILTRFYSRYPMEVEQHLRRLANSENWEVREWVASACGEVLAQNFGEFYPTMMEWAQDTAPNVRRAVALAAMYSGKTRNPTFAHPVLDLLEPLLADSDPYVKRNMGPYAIGAGLLRYYPEAVLSRLYDWSRSDNEHVRWNVAMVFTTAEGAKHRGIAKEILRDLSEDSRRTIRNAVHKANRNLARRGSDEYK